MLAKGWAKPEIWGIAIALVTLVAIVGLSFRDWRAFHADRNEIAHGDDIVDAASEVLSATKDMETGQRGYLITGKPEYLAPYTNGRSEIGTRLAELERLTSSNPAQRQRVSAIEAAVTDKLTELERTIRLRGAGGLPAALGEVETDRGKRAMDVVRDRTKQLQDAERQRLRFLEDREDYHRLRTSLIAAGGSGLLFILLVISAVVIRARTDAREQAMAAESAIRHEAERVKELLDTTLRCIGDAVISAGLEGDIRFMNPVAQQVSGWGNEALGRPLTEVFRIINEQTREPVESPVDKVRRTGSVAGLANHTLLVCKDGREVPIDDSGAPIRDRDGSLSGFVLVFRDSTQRRRAEVALEESEERFRTMTNAAPALLWVTAADGGVTFVNQRWLEYTGRRRDDETGFGWLNDVHPGDAARVKQTYQAALASQQQFSFECRLRRADGEYCTFVCTGARLAAPDGTVLGYVAAWLDVSERKRAEHSLTLSERRFRSLVAGTSSMVWRTNAAGECVEPQPGWAEFTGQTWEEYRGSGGVAVMHPDDREEVMASWRAAVQARTVYEAEYRLWHAPSSQYRYVVSRGVPLTGDDGELVEWIGTLTDISERKRLDEKLREAAKLESLGILAGGVAHDFNNLLVGILGNASLLEAVLPEGNERDVAVDIMRAGERAAALTQQMLAYSGRGRFVVEAADLSAEAEQIVQLVRVLIPKNITLTLNLEKGLPAVEIDRTQFQQLLMNLVINGSEAITAPNGSVTVATYTQEVGPSAGYNGSRNGDALAPGTYVVLEVRDTGHGMTEEVRARIFDPFFTTKFTGRGLGLAAALGIVKGHKGTIQVSSAPDKGSAFRVFLPAGGAAAEPAELAPGPRAEQHRFATILVVDDEEVVRKVAHTTLQGQGYRVLLAEDGRQAAEIFSARPSEISAILLDLTMPVMGGAEALAALRRIRANVPIVASSGYSETEALSRFGTSIDGFLQKPYSVKALTEKIRQALDGHLSARRPG